MGIEASTEKKPIVWIELLRILACFLVIVNHTNSKIFLNAVPSLGWFVSLTYFFVSKIAVPLFVMISGYLLLGREDTYGKNYLRILRIIGAWLGGSLFYYLYYMRLGKVETFELDAFLTRIIGEPITASFWYLYMYLGLLLMLPFLQKMVKGMQKKDFHVFFAISFLVYGIWPVLVHYFPKLELASDFEAPLFAGYVVMLLLGYYIKTYTTATHRGKWIAGLVLGAAMAFNVIATYLEYTYVSQKKEVYLFLDNRTLFPIVLSAACVFYIAKDLKFGKRIGTLISVLAACSFGIFLLADYLIETFEFIYNFMCRYMSPLLAVLIQEVWVFGVGFVLVFLIRLIPGMKKVL